MREGKSNEDHMIKELKGTKILWETETTYIALIVRVKVNEYTNKCTGYCEIKKMYMIDMKGLTKRSLIPDVFK